MSKLEAAVEAGSKEEIDNTMADLEAAWEEVESRDSGDTEPEPEPEPELTGEEPETETEPEPEPEPEGGEGEEPAGEKKAAPTSQEEKAPASWKPEVREEWSKLPPAVKQEIMRREKNFAVGIQQSREAAQRGEAYDRLLHPFRPMFTASGQNEFQGVQGVLQAAATLQMGSPAQKVKMVADLIGQYGVDLVALDGYLADGNMPAQAQESDNINRILEERLAPINQMVQSFQQQRQADSQRTAMQAGQTVQQFGTDPKNEFYNDVKMDMADILDLAASRGLNMSLEDAYHRACMLNPSISKVVQAREAAKSLQGKKKASVSISGGPGAPSKPEAGETVLSAVEAAWEAHSR